MGAAAKRMQLRCAVKSNPMASPKSASICEWALAARLRATPGTGGSNRAWGTQRERVERTLLSTTAAASSLERRAAVRGPTRTESGLCRQQLSPHRAQIYLLLNFKVTIWNKKIDRP